jgi:hypothetical protein
MLTRETNSDELEIVARQVDVILTELGQDPTIAFKELLERIEVENTQVEFGCYSLERAIDSLEKSLDDTDTQTSREDAAQP